MNVSNDKLKVLIVDDEIGMCKGAEKVLSNFVVKIDSLNSQVNFDYQSVNSGSELHALTDIDTFDIVLLDFKLPDANGLDLLKFLLQVKPSLVVVMITAYASIEMAVQTTKEGAYDFLAKPFTPEELRGALKKAASHVVLTKRAKKFEEEKKAIRFEFISVLSHELKSPLNAIDGYLNILRERRETLSQEDYVRMIDRSRIRVDGMRKLIFDLLDLTRIESGKKKREIVECNVLDVIKNCISLFEIEAKDMEVQVNLECDAPVIMQADRPELDIVCNNLVSNAIKYNRKGGTVNISLNENAGDVILSVRDTGIGLEPEEAAKLFCDFVRIKNEKTVHISGSGLGLSTVKKIAKLYDGDVSVQSAPGEGSVFTVRLKNK